MIPRDRKTSSRLSHRVMLQQDVRSSDGSGGYSSSWQDVAMIWAEIRPLPMDNRKQETYRHGQVQAAASHVVTLRYREDVQPDMRILFGARVFNIRHVINVDEADIWLRLYVDEGVAD